MRSWFLLVTLLLGCVASDEPSADTAKTAVVDRPPVPAITDPGRLPSDGGLSAAAAGIQRAVGGARWTGRTLTMPDVERLSAAIRALREAQQSDREIRQRIDARRAAGVTDPYELVREEPKLREAIASAGLTVEDYFEISGSLLSAMTIATMMRPEAGALALKKVPSGMPAANVDFVLKHEEAIAHAMRATP